MSPDGRQLCTRTTVASGTPGCLRRQPGEHEEMSDYGIAGAAEGPCGCKHRLRDGVESVLHHQRGLARGLPTS